MIRTIKSETFPDGTKYCFRHDGIEGLKKARKELGTLDEQDRRRILRAPLKYMEFDSEVEYRKILWRNYPDEVSRK